MTSATPGWGPPDPTQQPGYGTPGMYGMQPARNGFGVAALVLGILGAVLFWTIAGGIVLGLLAVIFGILGYRRQSRGEATNGGTALAGAIVGGLALVFSAVVLVLGASLLGSEEFGDLTECMANAGSAAEQQQCEDEFNDKFTR